MNRHCTSCKHFEYSQAEAGYYPGESRDCSFTCRRDVWEIDNEVETQETLHAKLGTAATCGEYEAAVFAGERL